MYLYRLMENKFSILPFCYTGTCSEMSRISRLHAKTGSVKKMQMFSASLLWSILDYRRVDNVVGNAFL